MNLAFELNQFYGKHIFFMDTKPNSLIDGLFTKVNYCDEQFTMNGIYLTFPGEVHDAALSTHKIRIESGFYRALCEIEQEILRSYLIVRNNKPVGSLVVQNKLSETMQTKYDIVGVKLNWKPVQIVIKISGIWENKQGHIGLSYRII
jgi:hypothetical protein